MDLKVSNIQNSSLDLARTEANFNKNEKLLTSKLDPKDVAQLKQAAQEFEGIFFEMMLKSMRDTVPKDGMLSGGNAEDIYRGMLDGEYAKILASQKTSGLASLIEQQLFEAMQKQAQTSNVSAGKKAYLQQEAID